MQRNPLSTLHFPDLGTYLSIFSELKIRPLWGIFNSNKYVQAVVKECFSNKEENESFIVKKCCLSVTFSV